MQDLISETQKQFIQKVESELRKAYEKVFGIPLDMNKADFSAFKRYVYLDKDYYCYNDRCFFIVEQKIKMAVVDGAYTLKGDGYIPDKPLYMYIEDGKIKLDYRD